MVVDRDGLNFKSLEWRMCWLPMITLGRCEGHVGDFVEEEELSDAKCGSGLTGMR